MAFQELKMKCLMAPVLAFVDFKKPFLIETDASIEGLGAVLSKNTTTTVTIPSPTPVAASREAS